MVDCNKFSRTLCGHCDTCLSRSIAGDPMLLRIYNGDEDPAFLFKNTNKLIPCKCLHCGSEYTKTGVCMLNNEESNRYYCSICTQRTQHMQSLDKNPIFNTYCDIYRKEAISQHSRKYFKFKCITCDENTVITPQLSLKNGVRCRKCKINDMIKLRVESVVNNTNCGHLQEYCSDDIDLSKKCLNSPDIVNWNCSHCKREFSAPIKRFAKKRTIMCTSCVLSTT